MSRGQDNSELGISRVFTAFHGVVTAFQFPARVFTAVRPANERKSPRTSELKKPR